MTPAQTDAQIRHGGDPAEGAPKAFPPLLTNFTQVAEEVCLNAQKPDWNKAANDAGRFFLERLQQRQAAKTSETEEK